MFMPIPTPRRAHPRRFRGVFLLLLALLASGCSAALRGAPASGRLGEEIATVFQDTAFEHAHWGVVVRSLDSGETLHTQNAAKLFMPASNMKLVTGAAVLEGLGPDFRYRTEVIAAGPIRNGVLEGDLLVVGEGDPTFSTRFGGDPRAAFRSWADSLRAHGVERISGAVVGIDTAFAQPSLGEGWAWDDLDYAYSAPFSALQLNDGVIRVNVFPARSVGSPALISVDPPTGYTRILNGIATVAPGVPPQIAVEREADGPGLILGGEIPADTLMVERTVAVREPTRFFVTVLRETLRETGIEVEGFAVLPGDRVHETEAMLGVPAPLFVHQSPPLLEMLPLMLKPSQNQIAEMMLRTLGRKLRGEGSAEAGEAAVDSILTSWELSPEELIMADGSGLSRYNFVAPELLIGLLTRMTRSPNWEVWYAALPVAGIDGTLAGRMQGTPAEGNVHAKTGTLSNVRALSGYVTTQAGERMVFSMIVNNSRLSSRDADRLVDAALARIAEWGR